MNDEANQATNSRVIKRLVDRDSSQASMCEMIYNVDFIASLPDTRYIRQRLVESFVYVGRTPTGGRSTYPFRSLFYGNVVRVEQTGRDH